VIVRREFGLCTECANKKEVFGHILYMMDIIEQKQTFIVELGFLGVHSDEDPW
jgi:hypothetical protein